MALLKSAWRVLVGIKDALVLILLLLFFGLLFAGLSMKPNATIKEGALLLDLNGSIVEQPSEPDGFAALMASGETPKQFRLRDVVRALDDAKGDERVKVVVLDLDRFTGGYPASLTEVANAVRRVREAGKPVLAYSTGYMDSGYLIAANASEIWEHPLGGTIFAGPGGNQLYYKGLADKLGINVKVYRVGKFKSFVEPYTRTDQSPEAKAASEALYGSLFGQWQELVARARPKAQIRPFLANPEQSILAANGDMAQANLKLGVVDKLGDRVAFGKRVAEIAGAPSGKPAGSFNTIKLANWLEAHPLPTGGDAIGVVTIAGEIVDGKAPAGTAGGETIANALYKGLAKNNLKALVVRVASPGGSVLGSEQIRLAILEAKRKGIPVVVSMGDLAASGGYWVSTPGDTIFAEPNTITGSIGIFGIIPTFENSLKKIGVTSDGVKTTPLSGQPDITGGFTPQLDQILQAGIENGYRQFIARVAQSRKMTPERVDEIAQGRVWDGGTARQIGLVDRFGTLKDALAEAAKRAGIAADGYHAVYLEKQPSWASRIAATYADRDSDDADQGGGDVFSRIAAERRGLAARALGDMQRLVRGPAVQVRCLECDGFGAASGTRTEDAKLFDLILARLFG
jgi:protease-4